MSKHNPNQVISFKAYGAVADKALVKITGDYVVAQASAATDPIVGVAYMGADDAGSIDVYISGIINVILGGTVAVGDRITADANGKGVKANPGAGVANQVLGRALAAGVAGDIIGVFVIPHEIKG